MEVAWEILGADKEDEGRGGNQEAKLLAGIRARPNSHFFVNALKEMTR